MDGWICILCMIFLKGKKLMVMFFYRKWGQEFTVYPFVLFCILNYVNIPPIQKNVKNKFLKIS